MGIVIYLVGRKFHLHRVFTVKVDGSDVNPGIRKEFSYRQIPGLTSLPSTSTAKKSMKMKFSADKIYYLFFPMGIQRLQICKIPTDVIGTLCPKLGLGLFRHSNSCLNYFKSPFRLLYVLDFKIHVFVISLFQLSMDVFLPTDVEGKNI